MWWKASFSVCLCTLCLSVCFSLFYVTPSHLLYFTCAVFSLSLWQSSFRGVYKCLWPSCGKVLTSSVGIKRHIRVLHLGWVEILLIEESVVCLLGMDIAWDLSILVVQVQIPQLSDLNQPLNYWNKGFSAAITSHEQHGTQESLFSNGTIFQLYFSSIKSFKRWKKDKI